MSGSARSQSELDHIRMLIFLMAVMALLPMVMYWLAGQNGYSPPAPVGISWLLAQGWFARKVEQDIKRQEVTGT